MPRRPEYASDAPEGPKPRPRSWDPPFLTLIPQAVLVQLGTESRPTIVSIADEQFELLCETSYVHSKVREGNFVSLIRDATGIRVAPPLVGESAE